MRMMDGLIDAWGELVDLRLAVRDRGNVWGQGDLALHKRLVDEIDVLVEKMPSAWAAWKEQE
jgi:hypothetical protein